MLIAAPTRRGMVIMARLTQADRGDTLLLVRRIRRWPPRSQVEKSAGCCVCLRHYARCAIRDYEGMCREMQGCVHRSFPREARVPPAAQKQARTLPEGTQRREKGPGCLLALRTNSAARQHTHVVASRDSGLGAACATRHTNGQWRGRPAASAREANQTWLRDI